jgi:hypothetical protein
MPTNSASERIVFIKLKGSNRKHIVIQLSKDSSVILFDHSASDIQLCNSKLIIVDILSTNQ